MRTAAFRAAVMFLRSLRFPSNLFREVSMDEQNVPKHALTIVFLLALSCTSVRAQQPAQQQLAAPTPQVQAKKSKTPASFEFLSCTQNMQTESFAVDFSGNVSNTGRTYEGPVCVEVFYNPIQQLVTLQATTTTVAGPNLSTVVLGGAAAGGVAPTTPKAPEKAAGLPNAVSQLDSDASGLTKKLETRKQAYSATSQSQDLAISDIAHLRQSTMLLSGAEAIDGIKNGYEGLKSDLIGATSSIANFVPTDRVDNEKEILLQTAQDQEDRLNALPFQYPNGTPPTFQCEGTDDQVGWGAWYTKCKDTNYTPLKAKLDANLQAAQALAGDSDNAQALMKKAAIVQYWNALFSRLGLRTDLLGSDFPKLDISAGFYTRRAVRCGFSFNQTSNTAINIATADLGPTLQGNDLAIKAQGAFVTISCGTPFAVSAGVGFNTIEQKQFAIVQSPDGKGGATNTFGLTSDSSITPTALAVVHVRLADWARHKYGFYGSLGIGGSLQNQSNTSPVQFLPGVSFSFWRTMYLTFGPDIGSQSSLTGGFKVGDPVPSAVSSVSGLIKTSHAVGFGFAITFTKP